MTVVYTMDKFFEKLIPTEQTVQQSQSPSYNLARPNVGNQSYQLVEKGWNRWQYLFFDPQKNCIEPFQRIGQNSVLQELDSHTKSCFATYKQSQKIKRGLSTLQ